ncbi:hypothetical protein EP47_00310 [Legionella norrlandica]|uniref:Coiled-coil protein n=1 Tax=Legionella norrlandica TaxID=1498499 RepID=A0A0A2ST67_9GAMM|nr:hypothetical protein [Legionella norrlandica]KGP64325.1 hypothetical protein EP47_00310 [Legionella norrlandica]
MENTQAELNKKFEIDKHIQLLQSMQKQPVEYSLIPLEKASLLKKAVKRIPFLTKFLELIDDTGDTVVRIGDRIADLPNIPGKESLNHGFAFGAVAMAGFDFLRIPIIYLAAYLLGEEVPINLNNNARWLYAAVLLGLTITAVAAPVTAPYMAFVIAGITLTVSTFLLGKTLYERYQLGKERKEVRARIRSEEDEMLVIQEKAKHLQSLLESATQEEEIAAILSEIAVTQEQYNAQKKQIQDLKNKELQLDQQIKALGVMKIVDRTVAVALAALTIAGLATALFFPQVGVGLLLGIAVFGGAYLVARVTSPLVIALGKWIYNKLKPSTEEDAESQKIIEQPTLSDKQEKNKAISAQITSDLVLQAEVDEKASALDLQGGHSVHESTKDVLVGLSVNMGTLKEKGKAEAIEKIQEVQPASSLHFISSSPSKVRSNTPLGKENGEDKGEIESEYEHPGNS